ncbi:MAG: UDP-N-acetylmuramoyl-L-alanyl-D-glutamate--2,6-diaminopimelate ligase [Clostridiales bacterium]|nr:UDP-N-acetylmuramoyl-L-alanyl-D-glutamate--2,6-diaminopimelate ligase [Clostridiales bacterium]
MLETRGDLSLDISSICSDHREAEKGCLFVCIEGFRADGHEYIGGAVKNGAAAILTQKPLEEIESRYKGALGGVALIRVGNARRALAALAARFYGEPSKGFTLVGVTGTKGKTTTTHMIDAIARLSGGSEPERKRPTGLIGTIKNLVGDEEIAARETTPESLELQKLFSRMRERGAWLVSMEVSSQGLALDRVSFCDFDAGLFTNFYNDHISPFEHHSMGEYLAAKLKIFELCGIGAINAGMEAGAFEAAMRAAAASSKCRRVYTYGIRCVASSGTAASGAAGSETGESKAAASEAAGIRAAAGGTADAKAAGGVDVYAEDIRYLREGNSLRTEFHAVSPWFEADISLAMPGEFNVENALAAITVCGACGMQAGDIARALSGVSVRGRTEPVDAGQNFTVLVDYAHNAASLKPLLEMLRAHGFNRIVTVFGCGGDRARDRRFDMGEVSGRLSSLTVITSDNPRSEPPSAIMDDIESGVRRTDGEYIRIEDRREAIEYALAGAKEGDLVVIAGKGHETTQTSVHRTIHFDDAEVARECLARLKGMT